MFYSKDWLEGTAELMPDEKGVFIDLLCHQHQKESIPADPVRLARMVGLPQEQFDVIWKVLAPLFNQTADRSVDRLVNKRLLSVMEERADKGHKNKIIGTFASLLRTTKLSKKQYADIKESFDVTEFLNMDTERAIERLTEWFDKRLKSIGNGDEDVNENTDEDKSKGKGKEKKEFVAPSVQEVQVYFSENGWRPELGTRAYNHYHPEWKNSQGKKVLNWKQTMRTVWMDESKNGNMKMAAPKNNGHKVPVSVNIYDCIVKYNDGTSLLLPKAECIKLKEEYNLD